MDCLHITARLVHGLRYKITEIRDCSSICMIISKYLINLQDMTANGSDLHVLSVLDIFIVSAGSLT
jgi:uncharacterized protein (UPF0179 family)